MNLPHWIPRLLTTLLDSVGLAFDDLASTGVCPRFSAWLQSLSASEWPTPVPFHVRHRP